MYKFLCRLPVIN